jgi:transcriptional regulator with XRE-family HTH domain
MMPKIRELDPGASPLHFFGSEVRQARAAAGMTLAVLGAVVPCDASTVSRVEAGLAEPTERFAVACDEAFPQMNGWFTRFWTGSQRWAGPHPPWFRDWVAIEQRAGEIRWWEPLLVPGLLQTPGYAQAIFASWRRGDGDIDAKLAARLARQGILDRDDPPDLRVLLEESVLHRSVGGPEVMAAQLEHLAALGHRPAITIQVVPGAAGAYAGLSGAFAVATMAGEPQAAYLETGVRGMTVLEAGPVAQAATMFDDLRDEALSRPRSLELITEVAEKWAHEATPGSGGNPATAEPTAAAVLRSVADQA